MAPVYLQGAESVHGQYAHETRIARQHGASFARCWAHAIRKVRPCKSQVVVPSRLTSESTAHGLQCRLRRIIEAGPDARVERAHGVAIPLEHQGVVVRGPDFRTDLHHVDGLFGEDPAHG